MLKEKIIDLKHQLMQDASLVEEMIAKSIKGLMENNQSLLEEVIHTYEPKVNEYDRAIEQTCVELIAQFEPVARDLRMVVMVIKMNKDLERMGDHAVNICESGLHLIKTPASLSRNDLKFMGENAVLMLKDSINAFVNENVVLANAVCERDNVVDDAGDKILKDLTEIMRSKKETIPQSLQMMRIAHNLERIADLSTNIAEEVIYIVEGRDVKHHPHD